MSRDFIAILMAGGKSTRMGKDKALIPLQGVPLWEHQFNTLQNLKPREIWISATERPAWCPENFHICSDLIPKKGPLGGIASALQKSKIPVLILAIDMPRMTAQYLSQNILKNTPPLVGCVPTINGLFQPLCAIYPPQAWLVAEKHILKNQLSLQKWCHELQKIDLIKTLPVPANERNFFENWNTPQDIN